MPLEENNLSNQTAVHPGNEPPAYYNSYAEEPAWNVSRVTPSEQTWNDCPPAYESLPDIPIWSVPGSQLTAPTGDQLWDFPLPIPEYSEAPPNTNTNTNHNSANTPTRLNSLFKKKFQRGKPICVGVLVISCAFVQITVGTMLAFNSMREYSETLTYGIPYWTSVCYLITGCLLIAAKVKTTRSRVKTSLAFDILSMILSVIGLVFNTRDIIEYCNNNNGSGCYSRMQLGAMDTNYILLSANVVLLCLCLAATVIGIHVLCLPKETPPPEVIENYFIMPTSPPDFFQTSSQLPPPPYKENEDDESPH